MKSDVVHIGVDVSKGKLDVYNPNDGTVTEVGNEASGFRRIRDLARRYQAVVCCEPTGGYELDMVLFLQRFKVRVAYCDGYKVRHYAKACGEESKNDKIDARMISLFADNAKVHILGEKDAAQLKLRQRYNLYKTFVDMHVILAQKASSEPNADIRKLLLAESGRLERRAKAMLAKCVELANEDERMEHLLERFVAIDGVGAITALAILAWLPEIGTMSDGAVTKLAGLAPKEGQSGMSDHTRYCSGGRRNVRCALYMACLPAINHNHILGAYYEKVKQRIPGPKAKKWAMVPVMRKLLHLMNRLASDDTFELQKKPRSTAA